MNVKTRIVLVALLLSSGTFLSALEVEGWAIRICKKNTEAPKVTLKIGVPGDKSSQIYWTAWTSNEHDVIAVPDKFKAIKAIWVGVETDPPKKAVHLCFQFDDKTTKKKVFVGAGEDESQQSDSATCDCD